MKSEKLSFKVLLMFPEGVAGEQPPPHDIFRIKKPYWSVKFKRGDLNAARGWTWVWLRIPELVIMETT